MPFDFTRDQVAVQSHINTVGSTITLEAGGTLRGVVSRSADDMAKDFADEIGSTDDATSPLAMISFGADAASLTAGDYLSYDGVRAAVRRVKPRWYAGVLVRVRCLVEENAA